MDRLTRTAARRSAWMARGAALLLGAGACAAVLAPSVGPGVPSSQPHQGGGTIDPAPRVTAAGANIDLIIEQLRVFDAPAPADDPEDPAAADPEETADATWRFVGVIAEPDRFLAIVSIDGEQRILAAGDMVGRTSLAEVTERVLRVSENGVERDVHRSWPGGPQVTSLATPMRAGPAGSPGFSQQPIGARDLSNLGMPGQPSVLRSDAMITASDGGMTATTPASVAGRRDTAAERAAERARAAAARFTDDGRPIPPADGGDLQP